MFKRLRFPIEIILVCSLVLQVWDLLPHVKDEARFVNKLFDVFAPAA
jgi:hypothetical protein